ncbi:putative START-like domain, Bet v I type allergen [Medicago truncatula]|uniref:Disease-resistance response protein n=1 Tax=Medicago truncatula TaxID=3880 RepID=G7IMY7_MEDTR|nr:disease resistance response protein DRRG49-C [Medicago truncatula]AES65082.1 disease-resistance response protein [Medicago truncatula]AFK39952.1 unknown [Medicago truncatula]RHN73115.1 putative START-like domain, Bet v I type allergen [Medicago truncatula]
MGVINFEEETTSVVAPATLHKAFVTDADNLIPKVIDVIKSIDIVEGNGGAGTIKKLTFVEDGETKYDLHKVELVDDANWAYNYSIVGGDSLPDTVEKISFEAKLSAGPNGGSIAKLSVKYFTKGDVTPSEEELKSGKAKGDGLFKALEGYCLANPDYN